MIPFWLQKNCLLILVNFSPLFNCCLFIHLLIENTWFNYWLQYVNTWDLVGNMLLVGSICFLMLHLWGTLWWSIVVKCSSIHQMSDYNLPMNSWWDSRLWFHLKVSLHILCKLRTNTTFFTNKYPFLIKGLTILEGI